MTIGIKIQREMKQNLGVPTVAEIRELVATREDWQNRALVAIYNGQTEGEKEAAVTVEDNGIGFSGIDAEILTSFAEQFLRRQFLSAKQRAILAKKMPKYAGQLWHIAVAKKGGSVTVKAVPAAAPAKADSREDERIEAQKDCDRKCAEMRKQIEALEEERKTASKARALMICVEIESIFDDMALLNELAYC